MGDGLQGGGALIGKPHAHKEPSLLQAGKKRWRGDILLLQNSWPRGGATPIPQVAETGWDLGAGLLLYRKWRRLGGAWGRGYSYTASDRD